MVDRAKSKNTLSPSIISLHRSILNWIELNWTVQRKVSHNICYTIVGGGDFAINDLIQGCFLFIFSILYPCASTNGWDIMENMYVLCHGVKSETIKINIVFITLYHCWIIPKISKSIGLKIKLMLINVINKVMISKFNICTVHQEWFCCSRYP